MIRTALHRFALPALLTLLSACSVLPQAEPVRVFLLPGAPVAPSTTPSTQGDLALRVHTPQASRMLASPRIAVVPQGHQLSAYQGARWADPAPQLLRDRLIEALRASGRLASVSSDDSNLQADLELIGDLRAFQSVYQDGTPQVLIRLDATLVDSVSRRGLASRHFEIRQPSTDAQLDSVVEAFGQASDELSRQLLAWVLAQQTGDR